jgi:hypothetical protein
MCGASSVRIRSTWARQRSAANQLFACSAGAMELAPIAHGDRSRRTFAATAHTECSSSIHVRTAAKKLCEHERRLPACRSLHLHSLTLHASSGPNELIGIELTACGDIVRDRIDFIGHAQGRRYFCIIHPVSRPRPSACSWENDAGLRRPAPGG